ncbi:MAG: energy transducer TonB [Saprospiraceae bacterium]|nr:energy transducer TonB [Saprospiraceae bacterium]
MTHRPKKKKDFLPQPKYEGGPKAMGLFIDSHLVYPKSAIEHKISGIVKVKIEIDYHGNVINARAMNHLGHGCDEEAERVSSLLKFDVPKLRQGKVRYFKTIHIRFGLKQTAVTKQTFKYQLIPDTHETEVKGNTNYQYKITLTNTHKPNND